MTAPSAADATATPLVNVHCVVNQVSHSLNVAPMRRLLDVLRLDLGLTGSKEGCGEGECGACSVLVDGLPVNACLIPIVQCSGAVITTIEGLADHRGLRAIQSAFIRCGGAQCGICTPGMVVTASWLVDSHAGKVLPESAIREHLAGNLCRCTGYGQIVDAVVAAIQAEAAPSAAQGQA